MASREGVDKSELMGVGRVEEMEGVGCVTRVEACGGGGRRDGK